MSDGDPFLWLEGIQDEAALGWVEQQNAKTAQTLAAEPSFAKTQAQILEVLDSEARIPFIKKHGDYYYNFWQDKQHERGIWRRTTLDSYTSEHPNWETVIDLDALSELEDTHWVWHGASFLGSKGRHVLISLSPGGTDADVTREFDLVDKRFIPAHEGGFTRGVDEVDIKGKVKGGVRGGVKGGLEWVDADQVLLFTDLGPGTTTNAGYPRLVHLWRRGTPLNAAQLLYEGQVDDEFIYGYAQTTPGFERIIVERKPTFFTSETFLVTDNGNTLTKIEIPESAQAIFHRDWLLILLRDDWDLNGTNYRAGSLLATPLDDYLSGARTLTVLFEPTATASLQNTTWTQNHLVLTVLDDVKYQLSVLTPPTTDDGKAASGSPWESTAVDNVDPFNTVAVWAVDSDQSDEVWLVTTGYLAPSTLSLGTVSAKGITTKPLKQGPSFFPTDNLAVEQHFAISDDGTKVPYFIVGPKEKLTGNKTEAVPTLLTGYGGFEVSLTPSYSGSVGRAWLENGGVYVVANIRGGGEYGPNWHDAARQQKRHKAYEDFAAVARDLVARGITTSELLAAQGGSNGGLLTGNMLTKYPELFGAIIIQVPLLDMKRYSHLLAGASWMSEYGDPDDPEQWEWLRAYSPYHQINKDQEYPPVLVTTSTLDDRVHPGHARKMVALLESVGADVTYYENTEGGHGGSATNQQTAYVNAVTWTFLRKHLMRR